MKIKRTRRWPLWGGSFQRVHGSTDKPKTWVILKLPGSENGDEDGEDDRYQPGRRVMTDDVCSDGNDFLRLQDHRGGVSCFYYTDLKKLRFASGVSVGDLNSSSMRLLTLPSEVTEDDSRHEVMRAWLDKGMLSLSLCHKFPAGYTKPAVEIWGMLLSDIFHHVVDALVLETKIERPFIQEQIRNCFEEVLRSDRGSRTGVLKESKERKKELSDPDVSGDDHCVEIVRIVLLKGSIRVIVRVGMWLPDNEESVWGNLLYDLTYMVALSMRKDEVDEVRGVLAKKVLGYIENPSSEYSGRYY